MHRSTVMFLAVTICLATGDHVFGDEPITTGTALAVLNGETPPAPPAGYESEKAAIAALEGGKVPIVNLFEPTPANVVVTGGVEYSKAGETPMLLDLYQPKGISKPAPALIFIHGGGWKGGKRNDYRYYCQRFAAKGYVTATITYRLTSRDEEKNVKNPFPAALHDAKAAVRFIRANAAKYYVNPDQIAVLGGSAGGHLSMMVGYSSDVPELEGDGGNSNVSSRVQAVVNLYGPTDLTKPMAQVSKLVIDFVGGKKYDEAPEIYSKISPLTYITKDDPPTLILHGTVDAIVQVDQSDLLAAKLKETGVPYIYDRLPGWPHAMDLAAPVNERCTWLMDRFLAKYVPLPE
ncbi:MAG: alpha/beta hydrolase fold domain-containing protein [Planctomycetaceae bacterium]